MLTRISEIEAEVGGLREQAERYAAKLDAPPQQLEVESTVEPLDTVHRILADAAHQKHIQPPTRTAIQNAMQAFPKRNHVAEAEACAYWAVHGNGRGRKKMALAGTYRNWLKNSDDAEEPARDRSAYD